MPLKLVMSWDVIPEQHRDYLEFLLQRFVPQMEKLGFEVSDAWTTVYGNGPQVMVCSILPDELEAERRMNLPAFKRLMENLNDYIEHFEMKLIPAGDGFQF